MLRRACRRHHALARAPGHPQGRSGPCRTLKLRPKTALVSMQTVDGGGRPGLTLVSCIRQLIEYIRRLRNNARHVSDLRHQLHGCAVAQPLRESSLARPLGDLQAHLRSGAARSRGTSLRPHTDRADAGWSDYLRPFVPLFEPCSGLLLAGPVQRSPAEHAQDADLHVAADGPPPDRLPVRLAALRVFSGELPLGRPQLRPDIVGGVWARAGTMGHVAGAGDGFGELDLTGPGNDRAAAIVAHA